MNTTIRVIQAILESSNKLSHLLLKYDLLDELWLIDLLDELWINDLLDELWLIDLLDELWLKIHPLVW